MPIELAFGRNGVSLTLPSTVNYRVLESHSAQPLPDVSAALDQALDEPIGTLPIRELAAGKRSVAISVCDITRPAPNQTVLPPLLRRLYEAGISSDDIVFCIATGLHRPATPEEIRHILGHELAAKHRVVNHDARDLASHRALGATASGTPVYIDEAFVSADLHITLGFIEPHLMLGFSGGRKLIAPGLAAQETIKVLHSPKFMRDSRASEGSVADNPLHRELLEIARMARHDFLIDVALARDRRIAAVFAGEPEQAHAKGMNFVSEVMLERLAEPVDAIITSAAGYPLDLTFYQAIKGVTAAAHAVRQGGRILLVAECQEGAGAREFSELLETCRTPGEFLALLDRSPVIVDQWQLEKLALAAQKAELLFYVPGLPASVNPWIWGQRFDSLPRAVAALLEGLPARAQLGVLPDGPYVLARAAA